MEWKLFFRPHILERGYYYYLDDKVNITSESNTEITAEVEGSETYTVRIEIQNGNVDSMECSCPYAEDGNNCKHMAATLYQYFDSMDMVDNDGDEYMYHGLIHNEEEKEIDDLLEKIPEDVKYRLLVDILTKNIALKNSLKLQYDFEIDTKQMRAFKNEISNIVSEYMVRGYVDWENAFSLCCSLKKFLDDRVDVLIEKNCLLQAFELNNQVIEIIGTIDMDDSDGGGSMVAENCYERWVQIYQKANDVEKEKIKEWFLSYKEDMLFDYIEEYLFEFRKNELASVEEIKKEIDELDTMIATHVDSNDCGYIYSVTSGRISLIEKRLEYMNKLGASKEEIDSFCKKNRQFFVVRNMEIDTAIENEDYENAIVLLIESKKLDQNNKNLIEKYSHELIELYKKTSNHKGYVEEMKYNLLNCMQLDVTLFKELKKNIKDKNEWAIISDDIINTNKGNSSVYIFLNEEKRYNQMMDLIEKSNNVYDMNNYVKILSENVPDRVIRFYEHYLIEEMQQASDRKQYRYLVNYLRTMSFCSEGKENAKKIAASWRIEYRRRPALLDELRKIGY